MDILKTFVTLGSVESWDSGVVARERHEDGSWHLHCYAHAKMNGERKRFRVPHKVLDQMGKHGNYQAALSDIAVAKYCMKEGDFIFWGRDPTVRAELRGKKRNLVLAEVLSGKTTIEQAVENQPELLLKYNILTQNLNQFKAAKRASERKGRPEFHYIVGPSGVGKTTLAMSLFPAEETYKVPLPSQHSKAWWFNGYHGQKCLVFDNVSKETVPPYDLLCQMVDNSMCLLPVKGGLVTCSPCVVLVTSVLQPGVLWENNWDIQMKRRLTALHEATIRDESGRILGEQEAMGELENGINRRSVLWETTRMDAFKILTLPPDTTRLLDQLRLAMVTLEETIPVMATPPIPVPSLAEQELMWNVNIVDNSYEQLDSVLLRNLETE